MGLRNGSGGGTDLTAPRSIRSSATAPTRTGIFRTRALRPSTLGAGGGDHLDRHGPGPFHSLPLSPNRGVLRRWRGLASGRSALRHDCGTALAHGALSLRVTSGQRTPNPLAVGTFHAHGRTVPSQLCGMSLGLSVTLPSSAPA